MTAQRKVVGPGGGLSIGIVRVTSSSFKRVKACDLPSMV